MTKPIFSIDLNTEAPSCLAAHLPLARSQDDLCFHIKNNYRYPLGIYNISLSRICEKLIKLAQLLEAYFSFSPNLEILQQRNNLMLEVIDYIELSLYAAAEHVDDIDAIACGFFNTSLLKRKSVPYKVFQKCVAKSKRFVSSAANAIKHHQARIRMFSTEFTHAGIPGCLHGYFIEGVENGVICSSGVIHKNHEVFSITTLAWEIIFFVLSCSRALSNFLHDATTFTTEPQSVSFQPFSTMVAAAARLPLYTFGEEHPFSRATIYLSHSGSDCEALESGLYGSIRNRWLKTGDASFGPSTSRFAGDGKSKRFKLARPTNIVLHHWD